MERQQKAAPQGLHTLAGGIWLSFTRLDSHLAPRPVQAARLLVFDFCRAGRRAIPDGPEEYAIVTEAHAAVSFAAPDEPFYLPGGQYEGLQLFIDPDAVQADSFLTVMGLEIGGIADYFCRDGVHCCPVSEAITDILDEQWSDAEYATPGELRYTAVRLLYELLRLPDDAEAARCPARQVELVRAGRWLRPERERLQAVLPECAGRGVSCLFPPPQAGKGRRAAAHDNAAGAGHSGRCRL